MLGRVQRGLEALYRVDTGVAIDDFMVDRALRDALVSARRPREQLLVHEADGEMAIALFIDPGVIANLAAHDPARRLGDHNFADFVLAIEGVSHFIYAIWCARAERRVSQLELELQAEVDKYVTCLLTITSENAPEASVSERLRHRLFGDAVYEPDLDHEEHARYRAANDNAQRYTEWLEQVFVAPRRIPEMLDELRRFYRLGLTDKLSAIARAA